MTTSFEHKYNVGDTVYVRDKDTVTQMKVKSIQPIIQIGMPVGAEKDILYTTVRYYVVPLNGFNSDGKLLVDTFIFKTSEEAFK
jgi:hypothetical protein